MTNGNPSLPGPVPGIFVAVLGLLAFGGEARAQSWSDFAAAFPAFPCQDGWMGCLVDGTGVSPDLATDAGGRRLPADLRIGWFDLKATATFSPFAPLSEYKGEAPVAVAANEDAAAPPQPAGDDDAVAAAPEPSEETRRAEQRAEDAAADAAAARASKEEADRQAREAAEAKREADEEARAKTAAEAAARREADDLARRATEAAARAQASERAALERQAAEAKARAAAAEKERLAAEATAERQRTAEEAARRKAEEEERKRQDAEAARVAAEEARKRQAEEERRRQDDLARQEAERKAAADAAAAVAAAAAAADAQRKAAEEAARVAAAAPTPTPAAPAVPEPAPPEPDDDAAAVVEPGTPPAGVAADGDCSDTTKLEPTALLGKLSEGQAACLEQRLAAAAKMTDKKKISLVLMANAWSKGDKTTWESLVKRHLDEIDQSDPDLCYKYALHLSKMGAGRASGVIRWANTALENRTVWTGDTYTNRVYSLYKVRAAASQMLWQDAENEHKASPTDESRDKVDKYRNMTKVNAREWYEYAKSAAKDFQTALQLCVSAAGTSDYCEAG